MIYVIVLLIIVNIVGFTAMGLDKRRAIKNGWRISEKDLFTMAALGGGIGIGFGMKVFHHKTLHNKFKIGVPFIIIANIATYAYVLYLLSKY